MKIKMYRRQKFEKEGFGTLLREDKFSLAEAIKIFLEAEIGFGGRISDFNDEMVETTTKVLSKDDITHFIFEDSEEKKVFLFLSKLVLEATKKTTESIETYEKIEKVLGEENMSPLIISTVGMQMVGKMTLAEIITEMKKLTGEIACDTITA